MNSRFKFRAWDNEKKKMVYQKEWNGDPFYVDDGHLSYYWNNKLPIMQCTGLKDKNGKFIFERDLLYNNGFELGEVHFVNGSFVVGKYNVLLIDFDGDNKRIVGNIYENPELLE